MGNEKTGPQSRNESPNVSGNFFFKRRTGEKPDEIVTAYRLQVNGKDVRSKLFVPTPETKR
jgi:hypothetical protein